LVGGEHEKVVRFHTTDHDTEAAEALAREQGWLEAGDEANWPLLFVAFGLAALYRERDLEQLDHSDPAALAAERQRLRTVHMQLDGRLSPLRFAVFELARTNRILEIRESALRIDNRGLRLRLGDADPE